MKRLSRTLSEMMPTYDAIVIGSGYGGGVAASRLVRMGYRVVLLERGLEWHPGEYPDTPAKALHQFQIDGERIGHIGNATGIFDLRLNPDMNVLVGCGLGGTSLINANVALQADRRVFDDPCWPAGINDADLQTGYERAIAMLSPVPYPQTSLDLNKLKALEVAGQALGVACVRPPINVTFSDGVNSAGIHQRACTLCGDCCSGCNVGAKNTTLMNYLPDAVAGGAQVFCGIRVSHVERAINGWTVAYQPQGFGWDKFTANQGRVSAGIVVVAAGALGSTEILLRSRDRGLPLSPRVGTSFTGNGDVLAFGYNNDVPIDGIGLGVESTAYHPKRSQKRPVGPTITGLIDLRDSVALDDGIVIEEGVVPGGLGAFFPAIIAASARAIGSDTDKGDLLSEISREVESLTLGPYHGAVNNTQTFLVMAHDGANGEMRLANDQLRIDWPDVGSKPIYRRIAERIRASVAATGGTYVPNPIWTDLLEHQLVTVHPLGGCPMGSNATSGVVDRECRVFSSSSGIDVHTGLYVCDGSVMPRSLGVNPLLTISAVSERAMILLAQRENRTIDMAPRPAQTVEDNSVATTGIRFTERMAGTIKPVVGGPQSDIAFVVTVSASDATRFIEDRAHEAELVGTVDAKALSPDPLIISGGRFNLFNIDSTRVETKQMEYAMPMTAGDGHRFFLHGIKQVHDDKGFDLWHDVTTLTVTIHDGPTEAGPKLYEGTLFIKSTDLITQLQTMTVTNAPDLAMRLSTLGRFGHFFAGQLFDSFGGPFARTSAFDPVIQRPKRPLRTGQPEVHFFKTVDEKNLRLTRYQGGVKGPVILSHGLGVSSQIFSIDTIETNLLEYLYTAGYDCWLLDYRASIDLPYSEEQHNADTVAKYDYSSAVDCVRRKTGRETVQMIAHCYGGMTFTMAMLSGLSHIRAAVVSQISTHAVVPWWPQRLLAFLHAPDAMNAVGMSVLDARATVDRSMRARAFDALIGFVYPFAAGDRSRSLTSRRITALYGQLYELSQLNQATLDAMPEMFGKANIAAFQQLSAIARAGHVVRADGTDDYLRDSNLRNFAIPTLFVHGALNRCFETSGTQKTLAMLSRVNGGHLYDRRVIAETGHIDCIFGKNAARDVYPAILRHLDQTAKQ
ncbi:alpha/beta fold hydrolase [Bradyrhizobium barranii]